MQTHERIYLSNVTKQYGMTPVLNGIDVTLSTGERVALVGENGTGKTTLARIISGDEDADTGTVRVTNGVEVGYLPQDVTGDEHLTVQHYIERATGDLDRLRQQMQQLEQQMTEPLSDDAMTALLDEYGMLQATYERRGGYTLSTRIDEIFAGLGISHLDTDRSLSTLSGGERTRVALTALLLREPDVLILDEPTNHLDFASIEWLETYLMDYPHALLMISHDRTFINRIATSIAELHPIRRQLTLYHGNYEAYLEQRDQQYQQQVAQYNEQQNQRKTLQRLIQQETHNHKTNGAFTNVGDKFLRNFKKGRREVQQGKAVNDAKQRLQTLEADMMDNPRHEWRIEYRFNPLPLPSSEPLRLQQLSKAYGDQLIFADVNAVVRSGERVALVAPNGTGKSTLLRIIAGYENADSGSVRITPSTVIGFLDQDGETLDADATVLASYREVTRGSDSDLMAELHRSGLFSDAALLKKTVRELSVGQRRKLGLARLIASRANVLLLDEPTNHLDPVSLEALEDALLDFDGTILAVSHDRRFVEKVATRIWRFDDHSLIEETPQGDQRT